MNKNIFSILTLLFLTNTFHGAQENHNEADAQRVQLYTGATQEIRLNHEIDGSTKYNHPIGIWTQSQDYILFKDEYHYRSTGSTSPENDENPINTNIFLTKSALKEMQKAQNCLENIHEKIIYNITSMRLDIEHKKYSLHANDEYDIMEAERRLEIFKDIFFINNIELNKNKRRQEIADFERSMRAYNN